MTKVLPGPKPSWLKRDCLTTAETRPLLDLLDKYQLHSVCQEAHCPNCQECFAKKQATFMLLGDICTRNCRYCAVKKGVPEALDSSEPQNIVTAVKLLSLKHVVLTSVCRDDLPDGGVSQFVKTIKLLRAECPGRTVEILVPDYGPGYREELFVQKPEVFNHNIETVRAIFSTVRPKADFEASLALLEAAAAAGLLCKSGFMVGLGESPAQVLETLKILADRRVKVVTIGQYLPPSSHHYPVTRYVEPAEYAEWAAAGRAFGIKYVFAGPLVRSSYMAAELWQELMGAADNGNP